MKFNLKALTAAVSCALLPTMAMAAQTTDEKLAQLEQQIKTLQTQQTASLTEKFNFNGFISGAYISSDNDAGYDYAGSSANFDQDSKFGLQGAFQVNDSTQAVMQLMMRGEDNWDPELEWAYLSHSFANGIQVRGGKLRLPLFMYSDYLDVGYAQPWARPPEEVYNGVPVSAYTGLDISYDLELADSTLTFQGFGGSSRVNANADLKNSLGGNLNWTDETWTLRATYAQGTLEGKVTTQVNLSPDPSVPVYADYTLIAFDDDKATFTGVGASYDNGNYLVVAEWTRSEIDGLYPDTDSGYLTLGYRINDFTPYATLAYLATQDDAQRTIVDQQSAVLAAAFNAERTSYSLGLRWDVLANIALKFDATYAHKFGDTSGRLPGNLGRSFDDTLVYTVKFDAVF
ncbi:hypothetical protein LZP73_03905 [Shewanella sp. AS16]|uniref:hypothetical protein n=1 Tax=Shewanella sp. AS16 TaxID=2907625 RepID=UPI001F274D00|nr:hypothetical protein [Shewanella sp. AS16]MCE9685360.1 hypothetical protein [Shewanella sp. AS16]